MKFLRECNKQHVIWSSDEKVTKKSVQHGLKNPIFILLGQSTQQYTVARTVHVLFLEQYTVHVLFKYYF